MKIKKRKKKHSGLTLLYVDSFLWFLFSSIFLLRVTNPAQVQTEIDNDYKRWGCAGGGCLRGGHFWRWHTLPLPPPTTFLSFGEIALLRSCRNLIWEFRNFMKRVDNSFKRLTTTMETKYMISIVFLTLFRRLVSFKLLSSYNQMTLWRITLDELFHISYLIDHLQLHLMDVSHRTNRNEGNYDYLSNVTACQNIIGWTEL